MKVITTILAIFGASALLTLGGCASERVQQLTFDSPEDAVQALLYAASGEEPGYGKKLFGPEVDELSSGDPEVDRYEKTLFAEAVLRKHELSKQPDGSYDILVGNKGNAFPIPLVEVDGRWMFDTLDGIDRLTDIRVGYNELETIQALRAIALAQQQYHAQDRNDDGVQEYAARIRSATGTHDGLYWPTGPNEPNSPLGMFYTRGETPDSQSLGYNGYFYKLLDSQGAAAKGGAKSYRDSAGRLVNGYGVLAYPAVYDETGVMTFIMSTDGVIYQKDLGASDTENAVKRITTFDPGAGWDVVDEQSLSDAERIDRRPPGSAFAAVE